MMVAPQRRSRLQIYLDVLRVVSNGAQRPTHIMYKSNLSWVPLKMILDSLMAQGLITVKARKKGRRFYEITEKGREILRHFHEVKELTALAFKEECL